MAKNTISEGRTLRGPGLIAVLVLTVACAWPLQVAAQAHQLVPAQPQAAVIELAVENVATTATGARSGGALVAQRVVRALASSGIPVGEIRMTGTFVVAEYEPAGVVPITTIPNDRRIARYRAVTGITVDAPDARSLGLLVDFARGAGATMVLETRVDDGLATPAP